MAMIAVYILIAIDLFLVYTWCSIFRTNLYNVWARNMSLPPSRRMNLWQRIAYVFRDDWWYTTHK